jgi:hypothetical protein
MPTFSDHGETVRASPIRLPGEVRPHDRLGEDSVGPTDRGALELGQKPLFPVIGDAERVFVSEQASNWSGEVTREGRHRRTSASDKATDRKPVRSTCA